MHVLLNLYSCITVNGLNKKLFHFGHLHAKCYIYMYQNYNNWLFNQITDLLHHCYPNMVVLSDDGCHADN